MDRLRLRFEVLHRGLNMGACRSCGSKAGAFRSICDSCQSKESRRVAAQDAEIAKRAGNLIAFPGMKQAFQHYGDGAGSGLSAMQTYDFKGDGRLTLTGSMGVTTTGVLLAIGGQTALIPRSKIRSVFADIGYTNGQDVDWSGYVRGYYESHFCWIQFHDRELESFQILHPYAEGQPATLKSPAHFLNALTLDGYSVTIQDSRIQYVMDALNDNN